MIWRPSTSSGVRSSKSSMSSACSSKSSVFRLLSSSKSSSSSSSMSCERTFATIPSNYTAHLELLVESRDVPVQVAPGVQVVHVPGEGKQTWEEEQKGTEHGDWTWRQLFESNPLASSFRIVKCTNTLLPFSKETLPRHNELGRWVS